MKLFLFHQITRDAFPAAKLCKKGFWKVFNVWTKSHFSNFQVRWWPFLWSQHSLDPPFLKGGSKFWLPPPEGQESEKLKKGGGSMVQGQVLLKGGGGGWQFSYLILSRLAIFEFRNFFTLCKIESCIWRKKKFSAAIFLWKKALLSCLKMNLKTP